MGGGGSYYDRDVSASRKLSAGFTAYAQEQMSRSKMSSDLLPMNRRQSSSCKSPFVYAFDVTGSVQNLPVIIFDKIPMIAGQIITQRYLDDAQVSLSAIGDITCDGGPLQVCDFAEIKKLDPWLKKIWREGRGGGQHFESYEFIAYYYARLYDMENATMPMLLFTGDESFRENVSGADLERHFGGQHQDVDSFAIFDELKKKFRGNVFLLHRFYDSYGLDNEIFAQWEKALGKGFVVRLPDDTAVADLTLGIIALAAGRRTLAQYVRDIKSRPLEMGGIKYAPQSSERIDAVISALKPLETALNARNSRAKKVRRTTDTSSQAKDTSDKKKPNTLKI